MNSPNSRNSPQFKNLNLKQKQSPKELKDKMRKNYKNKVQNCRELLMDRFRGPVPEKDLCKTLSDIYKSMFDLNEAFESDEVEILEELKNELVQEELDWWLREYEKSQLENVDWSSIEQNNEVICPVCQKNNLSLENRNIFCSNCKIQCETDKSLEEIKNSIATSLEKHASMCYHEPQFSVISELNEPHVYLICTLMRHLKLGHLKVPRNKNS